MFIVFLILHWILAAAILMLVAAIVPGVVVEDLSIAILAALILGVVNAFIKPVFALLTLPITLLTLGLFAFVINALMFMLAAWLVPGFEVAGFLPALLGSLLLSVANGLLNMLEGRRRLN